MHAFWNAYSPATLSRHLDLAESETDDRFRWLKEFVNGTSGAQYLRGQFVETGWWILLKLDINHPKIWEVIQAYSHVCYGRIAGVSNPIRFFPFSDSPENGGPEQRICWKIECYEKNYSPDTLVGELRSFVPKSIAKLP